MRILALDTSGGAASAALLDNRLVSEVYMHRENKHSETAMQVLDTALLNAGIAIGDVDLLAVCTGPGSFTGLRIGISIVKGLSQSLGLPCVAINTLDALKQNISCFDGILCPIMDARREEVYATASLHGDTLLEHGAYRLDYLLDTLAQHNNVVCFVGDGVYPYRSFIEEKLGNRAWFAPEQLMLQRAGGAAAIAAELGESDYANAYTLLPNYYRLSQAERLRNER